MKMSDVLKLIADIADIWQTYRTDAGVADSWFAALEPFETVDVRTAFVEYCRTAEYPPRPASIIAIITSRAVDRMLPDADDAWAEVREQMRRRPWSPYKVFVFEGSAKDGTRRMAFDTDPITGELTPRMIDTSVPEFSRPEIASAVESIGGWKFLCQHDDPLSLADRFGKVYATIRKRVMRDVAISGGSVAAALEEGARRVNDRRDATNLVAALQVATRHAVSTMET